VEWGSVSGIAENMSWKEFVSAENMSDLGEMYQRIIYGARE